MGISKLWSAYDKAVGVIVNHVAFFGIVGGVLVGAVTLWGAWVSPALRTFAPYSYVFVGSAFLVLAIQIYAFVQRVKAKHSTPAQEHISDGVPITGYAGDDGRVWPDESAPELAAMISKLETRLSGLQDRAITVISFGKFQEDLTTRLQALADQIPNKQQQERVASRLLTLEALAKTGEKRNGEIAARLDKLESLIDGLNEGIKADGKLLWQIANAEAGIRLTDMVLTEFPSDLSLPVDKLPLAERNPAIKQLADFVHAATFKLNNTPLAKDLARVKAIALQQAEERVAASVIRRELRPDGVDPIEWRSDLTTEIQAVRIREWLMSQSNQAKRAMVEIQPEVFRKFRDS